MAERIVVSLSLGVADPANAGYLRRALAARRRAEALGASLTAWGAESFAFDFAPEQVEEAVDLALATFEDRALTDVRFGAGIAFGEVLRLTTGGTPGTLGWSEALVAASRLARRAEPGEVLVDERCPSHLRHALRTQGDRRFDAEPLLALVLDTKQPFRRDTLIDALGGDSEGKVRVTVPPLPPIMGLPRDLWDRIPPSRERRPSEPPPTLRTEPSPAGAETDRPPASLSFTSLGPATLSPPSLDLTTAELASLDPAPAELAATPAASTEPAPSSVRSGLRPPSTEPAPSSVRAVLRPPSIAPAPSSVRAVLHPPSIAPAPPSVRALARFEAPHHSLVGVVPPPRIPSPRTAPSVPPPSAGTTLGPASVPPLSASRISWPGNSDEYVELAAAARQALLKGNVAELERLSDEIKTHGDHGDLAERMAGFVAWNRGAKAEGLRKLRAAADAETRPAHRVRALLAYGVALAASGRTDAALLAALGALARAREVSDRHGEHVCARFLAKLSLAAGYERASRTWAAVADEVGAPRAS